MGIRFKFNLVMLLVFSIGLAAAGYFSHQILQKNANEEVLNNAGIMMESAMAIRAYTVNQIKPLLGLQMKREFLPQSVPAYAATQNFKGLHERYPNYTYKEATLNPTNPTDRATDWEADVIEVFRNDVNKKELVGVREAATGKSLYLGRPIQITSESCLTCHSTPSEAPETMLTLYGTANGFGWKMNEVVGAQIVSVPMEVPLARAEQAFITFMATLVAIFSSVALILNIMLHWVVIRPVRAMSKIANEVSMGAMEAPEFEARGSDEIASLATSFNRMRRSLGNAMKLLDESMPG
jgi:HAMP domain-containing protein